MTGDGSGSTLLDRSLLALVLAGPLLSITVNRVVDGAHTVYDTNGIATGVGAGGHATLLTDLLLGATTLLVSGLLVLRGVHGRRGSFTWVAAFAAVAAFILLWRDSTSLALDAVVGAAAVVGAGFMRFDRRSLATVGWFTLCAVALTFAYTVLLHPPDAWVPCRPDKCTVAGQLLEGVFWAENGLAMYFVALTPFIAFVGPAFWRYFALVGSMTAIYLSGSRVGYVAAAVAIAAYVMLRKMQRVPEARQESEWAAPNGPLTRIKPFARAIALLPLLATIGSTVLLFFLPGSGLTERGSVYESVRAVFHLDPLFGPGLSAVQERFLDGHAAFLMQNEHGVAPYVLNETGLIGAVLFLMALLTLWLRSVTWIGASIALSTVGLACMFMTEAAVSIGYTAGSQFLVLLAAAGAVRPSRRVRWHPWRHAARTSPMTLRESMAHAARVAGAPACLLVALGAAVGGLASTQQPSGYVATTARVSLPSVSGLSDPVAAEDGSAMTDSLVRAFALRPEPAAGNSLHAIQPSDVQVTNPAGNVVRFTYIGNNPQVASRVVTAASAAAVAQAQEYGPSGGTYPVVAPVEVTRVPSNPARLILCGAVAGALMALVLLSWSTIRRWCGLAPRTASSAEGHAHG